MGEEIKVQAVEAVNGATAIQIDCDKGRLFVSTRDILKAINNYLYEREDAELEKMGFEKIDPAAPNQNLIV